LKPFIASGSFWSASFINVAITPGAMQLTATPCSASSSAKSFVSIQTPALAVS
jgi:hypothetical protein